MEENNVLISIKKNVFLSINHISLVIFVALFFICAILLTNNNFTVVTVATFVATIMAAIGCMTDGFGLFSFPILFIILTYIFHCSQFILYVFRVQYTVAFDIVQDFDYSTWINTQKYYLFSLLFLYIGMVLFRTELDSNDEKSKNKNIISSENVKQMGLILIILCFIPRIFSDVIHIYKYYTMGYDATYGNESGYLLTIGLGFYIGLIFLMVGYIQSQEYAKAKRTFLFALIYIAFSMLSGRRLQQVGVIVTLFSIYFYFGKKEKRSKTGIIILIIILWILISIIATIGDLRYTPDATVMVYLKEFLKNIEGKVISGQLAEFGDTGYSLVCSLLSFPKYRSYNYGLTYINSLFSVLPNIHGFIKKYFAADLAYTNAIPSFLNSNYGCSYLGELNFNFGWVGPIFAFFIGKFVAYQYQRIRTSIANGFNKSSLCLLLLAPTTIMYVRGSFSDFVRTLVYYGLFIILYCQIKKRYKRSR